MKESLMEHISSMGDVADLVIKVSMVRIEGM